MRFEYQNETLDTPEGVSYVETKPHVAGVSQMYENGSVQFEI